MRFLRGRNASVKLLLLFSLIALFALLTQVALCYYAILPDVYSQAAQAGVNALENMQEDLYTYIKSVENSLIQVYRRQELIDALAGGEPAEALRDGFRREAYHLSLDAFEPGQNVEALYLYTIGHALVSEYRYAATPLRNYAEDIYTEPAETRAGVVRAYAEGDDPVMLVTSYQSPSRQVNMIRFALKIYADNGARTIGYMVCDVDPRAFEKRMRKYVFAAEQTVWLQPALDRPVAAFGGERTALGGERAAAFEELTRQIEAGNKPDQAGSDGAGGRFYEVPQSKYNLTAYSMAPRYAPWDNQRVLMQGLLFIGGLMLLSLLCSFGAVSRLMTAPLKELVRGIGRIRSGESMLRLNSARTDEFRQLSDAIDELLDQNEALLRADYEAKLLVNQSAYRALQAQVNPHFLYNTLETMAGISASQNCPLVSSLSRALAGLFRYSMDMREKTATLEEELKHLKNYLFVMDVRTNHAIDTQVRFDHALLPARVPRLSIQPLVENAILHGLHDKRGDKRIEIALTRVEGDVVISVTDNGVGMDADAMNALLCASPDDALGARDSIGLGNINVRAKLLFGARYGVVLSSEKGAGTTATLTIPYRLSGEEVA